MTPNPRTEQIEEIAEVKNAEDVESVNCLSTSSTKTLQRLRFFLNGYDEQRQTIYGTYPGRHFGFPG